MKNVRIFVNLVSEILYTAATRKCTCTCEVGTLRTFEVIQTQLGEEEYDKFMVLMKKFRDEAISRLREDHPWKERLSWPSSYHDDCEKLDHVFGALAEYFDSL